MKFENVLKDKQQRQQFIAEYNKNNPTDIIPSNYFDFLDENKSHRGNFVELMGRYGKTTDKHEFPLGFKIEPNSDMTYTGIRTSIISSVN